MILASLKTVILFCLLGAMLRSFSEDADSRHLRGLLAPWRLLANGETGNDGDTKKGE